MKAITAKYKAVELITQPEKIRGGIRDLLKNRLLTYNILVDDFSIVNFKFSQLFEQAIEAKQTAEQLALKAPSDHYGDKHRGFLLYFSICLMKKLKQHRRPSDRNSKTTNLE